jgi:hypothetical protein
MHEFLEYPEKDLTAPAPTHLKQYREKDPMAACPSLSPLVLDLASKGASSWNKKAARLFREAFRSLDISECDKDELIEATFLTHVDYLRKLYLKQSLDVEGKVDAAQRAKHKARYGRRKEVTFVHFPIGNSFHSLCSSGNDGSRTHFFRINTFLK